MVLITGGTGFIGNVLVNYLVDSGINLRLISRNKVEGIETVVCDLQRGIIDKRALSGINTVFHLAGEAHDFTDAKKIEHIYRAVNVDATVRLAELSVASGVQRFVYVSSVKAGGPSIEGKCITEEDLGEPEGIYGKTKREAELKLLEIGSQSNLHVSIVRPSLVYGPGVKGNLGMMLSGIDKGWFPPIPKTGNRISMIHVNDLVRALLLVAKDERTNGEIFIVTDGEPHSSREVYEAMCQVVSKLVPRWSVPKFFFDIVAFVHPRLRHKIEKLLGNACYSSAKMEGLGFRVKWTLNDWSKP